MFDKDIIKEILDEKLKQDMKILLVEDKCTLYQFNYVVDAVKMESIFV